MSDAQPTPESNDTTGGAVPNPETGAGIGAGAEPNTMEPEETPDVVEAPSE